jgi:hypothetical protein
MQIGMAHARRLDVDQNLARPDFGDGDFLNAQWRTELMNDGCLHVTRHKMLLREITAATWAGARQ